MLYFSRWKTAAILLVVALGALFALPNVLPASIRAHLPGFLPSRTVVLGLDLQGGVHLLVEVERKGIIEERLDTLLDDVRSTLRDARIGYTGLGTQGDSVQVRIRDAAQVEDARRRLADLAQPIGGLLGGGIGGRDIEVSGEGEVIRLRLTPQGVSERVRHAVEQSIEVIRRRIDQLGTTEPVIQRQGEDRILVQVPGLEDPQQLKDLIGRTARLTFQLVDTSTPVERALQSGPPPGDEILYSADEPREPYLLKRQVVVSGEDLVDATVGFDQFNQPVINFRFNTNGARRFGTVTEQNVGRPFAIVLDNEVISAPVIREPIHGGSGQISGNFTTESATRLAIQLRAGALPAKLTFVEERTVGPGLGQDSIEAGEIAAIIGTVAVAAIMVAGYGFFGLLANLALAVNVILIFGILSALQATLTLPGIAGIVLTVGMAVDSNVIIFERIRDEVRQGRPPVSSLEAGFTRAFGTILDANVTTLIAALVLFQIGSGPIRGFAVTLAVGIVTTVFTAYTFTRLLIAVWFRRRRPSKIYI